MKIQLMEEDKKLQVAKDDTDKLIATLTIENAAAEKKAIEVKATQDACIAQKAAIEVEKEAADKDLQTAMPFVYAAQEALSGIKPNDIVELKSMR
jgi:hypothetical protein